jgi:hypothetical protein
VVPLRGEVRRGGGERRGEERGGGVNSYPRLITPQSITGDMDDRLHLKRLDLFSKDGRALIAVVIHRPVINTRPVLVVVRIFGNCSLKQMVLNTDEMQMFLVVHYPKSANS